VQIWELAKIYGEDNFIHKTVQASYNHGMLAVWYGIVEFNVPLDTV